MTNCSSQILEAAAKVTRVTDGLGRSIAIRRMNALDRLRLFKAIGGELSDNPAYLGMAIVAASVVEVDGVPLPAPTTEVQLEGVIQRLGDAGLEAAAQALEPARSGPSELQQAGN